RPVRERGQLGDFLTAGLVVSTSSHRHGDTKGNSERVPATDCAASTRARPDPPGRTERIQKTEQRDLTPWKTPFGRGYSRPGACGGPRSRLGVGARTSGVVRCPRPVSRRSFTSREEIRMARLSAVALALAVVALTFGGAAGAAPDLGANVIVLNPSMPMSEIQAKVDAVAAQQVSNEFGTQRYALLFEPGTYGSADHPLNFQVGYYTAVAGLGRSPGDVVINGSVYVRNQCSPGFCTALTNFWRSLSNLT